MLEKQIEAAIMPLLKFVKKNPIIEVQYIKTLCSIYVAGGAFASIARKERVSDYDIYFRDVPSLLYFLHSLFNTVTYDWKADKLENGLVKLTIQSSAGMISIRPLYAAITELHITSNAISFSFQGRKYQVILAFIGEPEKVLNTFDFEHCKIYASIKPFGVLNKIRINYLGDSQKSIINNELIYKGGRSHFALSALYRLTKFVKRGWQVSPETLINLTKDLQKVDLTNPVMIDKEFQSFYGITFKLSGNNDPIVRMSEMQGLINAN